MKIIADNATISNKQTQELSDGLLNDYLTVTVSNDEELLNSEYMAVKSHEGNEQTFDMYRITNMQTNDDTTTFTGIQLAYYELAGYVVEDIRPVNRTVSYVASQLLSGTEWRVGYVEANLPNVTDRFYYLSAKDSFTKLQEIANCEVVFKVEISGQGVTDKWVEIYSQLGDRTLKRFNYGSNALTVEREIGNNDIYTALIGRGKGEEIGDGYGRKLTFEDVVWSTANGNPVNKPKGQKYIELPQATAEYGIKTSSGKVPRIGIVEFEETEDVNVLIRETYNALIDVARPKVQFKSTVVNIGATNIGDTVTIHRHDLDIHYETRVYKVVRDKLDDDFTEVTLGDAISQSSTRKQARFYNTINNLQSNQNELATQVNYIGHTADGKNAINWGNNEPQFKRTGDLWFRDHPSITGERQMLVWTGLTWEIETDTSDLTKVEKEVSTIIAQAETDRAEAVQKINQAVIDSKVYADEVTTVSALRTKVLAADVITADMIQSNVSVVDKLFATDANVNRLTAKTAFINSVKAVDIAADRITGGTANFANFNAINFNASSITSGTVSGANSDWNLNTGIMHFKDPSSGDDLQFSQGKIVFQNGAQSRSLRYNAEGLEVSPGAGNTGTSLNSMIHLKSAAKGSYQYIQFTSGDGINQRVETNDHAMNLYHGPQGRLWVRKYSGDDYSGIVRAAVYETSHASGETLKISGNTIETPRYGSINMFLTPQGTGAVIIGAPGNIRYNINASDFVKQSSRTSKTNIVPLQGGLEVINALTPVSYNKIDKINQGIYEVEKGFISEDSPQVATPDGLGIYDSHVTAHLVKAVQELDIRTASETEELKVKIAELELKIQQLESVE